MMNERASRIFIVFNHHSSQLVSPVHKRLVENVIRERIGNIRHQAGFHTAQVLRTVVVGVSGKTLLEILLLIELIVKPHPNRDGKAVHGRCVVALYGHRVYRIVNNLALNGIIPVLVNNRQWGLRLDFVLQRRREALAQRRIHQ